MPIDKVEIIAEVANAHQGDPNIALKIAAESLAAGANAVKFQLYRSSELLVSSHPQYAHFSDLAFSEESWKTLFRKLRELTHKHIHIYCDVFGLDSLDLAIRSEIYGIKLHSSDLGNLPLIHKAAQFKGPILIATGGSTFREISRVLEILLNTQRNLTLLHGFQAYPTAVEDSNLTRLLWLRETFGQSANIGYMDHVSGEDELATTLPAMAIALGAIVIEKHVTLNRVQKGIDYYSSLDVTDDFARFVSNIRRAESALGQKEPNFSVSEEHYRHTVKKHWVTTRTLPTGHFLKESDLVMKRVHEHLIDPIEIHKLVNHRLKRPLMKEEPVVRTDIETSVWAFLSSSCISETFPGKALVDIVGTSALGHLLMRLKRSKLIERIVFCTTTNVEDDAVIQLAQQHNVAHYRDPTNNAIQSILGALESNDIDIVVLVNDSNILIDPDYIDKAIYHHLKTNSEHTDIRALPKGMEIDVVDVDLLKSIPTTSFNSISISTLIDIFRKNRGQYQTATTPVDKPHVRDWRLSLETPEDLAIVRSLLHAMDTSGMLFNYHTNHVLEFFKSNPGWLDKQSTEF